MAGVGWRSLISRKAAASALEFPGAAVQNFSKIKLPNFPKLESKTKHSEARAHNLTQKLSKLRAQLISQPRLLLHGLLLTAAALVVAGGNLTSSDAEVVKLLASESGYGAALDAKAAANVVANVADKTSLLVAAEATQTASNLNSQVNLPVSGDSYLVKRQVVDTAGNPNRGVQRYTVAGGDTLSSIAAKFGITTSTIKWSNNISDDMLKPGQALVILPISGLLYKVGPGDTPETLAAKYQSNAAQIISFNNAEVNGLQVGQEIIIPDGVKAEAPRPVTRTAIASSSSSAPTPRLTRHSGGPNGYSYGYCTWYVASRRAVPGSWGNAASWYYNAQFSGFGVGRAPAVGAIAWTSYGYYGHVALVEQVSGGQVKVSEMNYNGNWGRVTSRWAPVSSFSYIY